MTNCADEQADLRTALHAFYVKHGYLDINVVADSIDLCMLEQISRVVVKGFNQSALQYIFIIKMSF